MLITRLKTYDIEDPNSKRFFEDLHKIFNRNISFGSQVNNPSADQNIQGYLAEIADSGAANSSITIVHNLGYVPLCYDVKYTNKATNIFDFGTAWTKTKIFLASSTANTKFRVFIH